MREQWYITWSTPNRTADRAVEEAIARCGLSTTAKHTPCQTVVRKKFSGFGSLRCAAGSPRARCLLAELSKAGIEYSKELWRQTTQADLSGSQWLVFSGGRSIEAGANCKKQVWDHTAACSTCGAGARQVPPLIAKLGELGGKPIGRGYHDGSLIISVDIVDELRRMKATGFVDEPVYKPLGKVPDPSYRWLRITTQWPQAHKTSGMRPLEPCLTCRRAGHFDKSDGIRPCSNERVRLQPNP